MTVVEPAQPLTALALLNGQGQIVPGLTAHPPLAIEVGDLGSLGRLPEATREAAVREVRSAAAGLLDVDLIGLLVAGWRKHHDLTSAARRTLAAPASTELVDLATHQITAAKHPSITVLVDGVRVATLQLDLSVVFDVTAVLAGIRGGRLVALHTGRCDITATLAIDGTDVATRQAHLELPGTIPLGPGIRLLPAADYRAGGELAQDADDDPTQEAWTPARRVS
jgi:hypothetical protein